MLQDIKYKVAKYLLPDERNPSDYERCPECSRQMLFRDLFEHYFTEHFPVPVLKEKEQDDSRIIERERASRGDLVEDYDIHWETEEKEGSPRLPEVEQKGNTKLQHLRTYYERIQNRLESKGRVKIHDSTHIGSARGIHILRNFKSAVRRIEDDELENYEFDANGYPVIIEKK